MHAQQIQHIRIRTHANRRFRYQPMLEGGLEMRKANLAIRIERAARCGNAPGVRSVLSEMKSLPKPMKQNALDSALFALNHCNQSRNTKILSLLLDAGAELSWKNHEGWTFMHVCAWSGWVGGMEMARARGADLDAQNSQLQTPLMMAVLNEQGGAIEFLIKSGADHTLRDRYGSTAKMTGLGNGAALHPDERIGRMLVGLPE